MESSFMICISVTPTSRQLAKVDIFNACLGADLVELCLDHLSKEPDMEDILSSATKPILISCRREEDGGKWKGTEEQRQNMLRQAIIAGPDYVELELDIANAIPRYGKTKRVVSYTSLDRPLTKVDDIIAQALLAQADVLKFTWPTPNLDTAWPLLAVCTGQKELPIVGMGIGEASTTFSILAHKFGSPWIYAALEHGMEAHAGQPTVWDLKDTFDLPEIDKETRLVGLLGSPSQTKTLAEHLNAGMKQIDSNTRCLPFDFQKLDKLAKRLDVLKIRTLVVSPGHAESIRPFAQTCEPAVENTGCLDLLLRQADGWHGYNLLWRSVLSALESKLNKDDQAAERPLDRRNVMLLGTNEIARTVAYGVARRKGVLTISGPREDEAKAFAEQLGTRFVPLYNLYDTLSDVVILTDPYLQLGHRKTELSSGFLRSNMTVADVSGGKADTEFLREARERGCQIVEPTDIFQANLGALFKSITGQELPPEAATDE